MADANSTKVVVAAMVGNGLIAISKFTAAFFTGSTSTLAEAVHSVADTVNQLLLMIGLRRAKRRPTALHPLGFAAESYFWPFLVSIMIFLLGGAFALYEGIHGLIVPPDPTAAPVSHLWDYVVLGAAILFESYSLSVAYIEFKKLKGERSTVDVMLRAKDPTIPVVLMEDAAAMLGLVIAIGAVALVDTTGWHGWDSVGSMLIGLLLLGVSYLLSRETHSLLIGETASIEDRQRIVALTEADDSVASVTQLLSVHLGAQDVLLALKVRFAEGASVSDVEGAIDRVEAAIRSELSHVNHIFIEPDADYDSAKDATREGVGAPPRA